MTSRDDSLGAAPKLECRNVGFEPAIKLGECFTPGTDVKRPLRPHQNQTQRTRLQSPA